LNLEQPRTFNEKIQWLKLYGDTPLMTMLADKYRARFWVEEKIGPKYLIPLLGAWKSFDEIEFESLPEKFVLKCNHGCGWNAIIRDKDNINKEELKRNFDKWMKLNYAFLKGGFELQYRDISPCIIAEEYLENDAEELFDYKFWCFQGKVEFIMFLSERNSHLRMNNYDREWNLLPFTYNYPNSEKQIEKPDNLDEMISLAEQLAEGFPFVRVDFYRLNNGEIKFGEMTFTPASGICGWSSEEINEKLGNLIKM